MENTELPKTCELCRRLCFLQHPAFLLNQVQTVWSFCCLLLSANVPYVPGYNTAVCHVMCPFSYCSNITKYSKDYPPDKF